MSFVEGKTRMIKAKLSEAYSGISELIINLILNSNSRVQRCKSSFLEDTAISGSSIIKRGDNI